MSGHFIHKRIANNGVSTIGEMRQGPIAHMSFLESGPDSGATRRIGAGLYGLSLRAGGGFYAALMQDAFWKDIIAKGLPHLTEGGKFVGIIYPGELVGNVSGGIIPGRDAIPPHKSKTGRWEVEDSRDAFRRLYGLMEAAAGVGAQWQIIDEGGP